MRYCKKAVHLIDRKDFEKLTTWEKFNLRLHNAVCKRCRGYNRFSHVLKSLFGKISEQEKCLSCEEKEELKKKLSSK